MDQDVSQGPGKYIGRNRKALHTLPNAPGSFAVPFVTYGGVNSGRALYEMAKTMDSKGLQVLGGDQGLGRALAPVAIGRTTASPYTRSPDDPQDSSFFCNAAGRDASASKKGRYRCLGTSPFWKQGILA